MAKRRLRLRCVSDDEDDEEFQTHHQQGHTPHLAVYPPNRTSAASEHVLISDDDFADVSETFSPPSPPSPPPPPPPRQPPTSAIRSSVGSVCPIEDLLLSMGVKLRSQWLDSCVQGLESSSPGFRSLDVVAKAKLCFEQFLFSDMNYSGGGVLPENVESMHLVDLKGPFVLQVDEIVNISSPLRGRYQDASTGLKRCLKLCMTDGVQRVFGMEYRPIKDLKVLAPAGLKVAICNIHIRRGLLMLVPEAIEVLGGMVDDLEAARQRLVTEVNKPPRGRRTKAGVVPALAARATAAAWPRDSANEQTNMAFPQPADHLEAGQRGANLVPHTHSIAQRTNGEAAVPIVGLNHVPNPSFGVTTVVEEMELDTIHVGRESDASNVASVVEEVNLDRILSSENDVSDVASIVEEMHIDSDPASVNREFAASNLSTNSRITAGGISKVVDEDEPPLALSGNDEVPFTYIGSLSASLVQEKVHSIRGKIKCFLTGVKKFQYKQRATYELLCYVDDGSFISEMFIDHEVVQRNIGYSPEEVSAALSSSDRRTVSSMKETLTGFQSFLVNFEGIMLVELNRASKIPVAVELTEGCTTSDAWSLLRRLRHPISAQTPQCTPLAPIDVSP